MLWRKKWLSKSTWGEQPAEDILKFTRICICLFVSRLLAKRKTIQTWNLAHILPLILSKNGFFCFFEKVTPRTASLEKLLYYADFPQISSIVFFKFKITVSMLLKHKNWKLKKLVVPREARSSCGFVARGGSIRKKGHFIVKNWKRNRIELALQLQILSIMKRRILRHCLKGKKS